MSSKSPHITVRTNIKLKTKMQCLARYNGRSLSKEVELVLKDFIKAYEKEYGPIELDE